MKLTLNIYQGREHLYYITSPDIPGLFIAEKTLEAALAAVPSALADLEKAAQNDN